MRTPNSGSIPERLTVASRGSRLALTQTMLVVDDLRAAHPGLEVDVLEVSTTGDKDQRPFSAISGKGLFTTEVERALLDGRADLAVHSAKDLTAELAPGCRIGCVPPRATRSDVVVGGTGDDAMDRLRSLPPGSSVGTSSMRRRAQLAEVRRDVAAVEFRGNLDTRLEKVSKGVVQAAILAAAGMERLGVGIDEAMILDPQWWVPAPGQGVLAVEIMEDRTDVAMLLAPLNDRAAEIELNAERAFSARLEGGCSVPLGCTAVVDGSTIVLSGYLGALDGRAIRESLSGSIEQGVEMGVELAEAILVSGGEQILSEIEARTAPVVEQP